jgi:hypothetical protein
MTEAPVSLDSDRQVGTNAIEIMVQHPAVLGRLVSSIVLNGSNPACNFPGANWRKGVQPDWATDGANQVCRDTYLSAVPWTELCGLVRGENSTHVWFGGNATISYSDSLGSLDGIPLGSRQLSSTQQFTILQPKMIREISTQVRILDEPRLLGAVTSQQFNYLQGTATLAITLSLAAPLRTAAITMVSGPNGISITQSGSVDNSLCGDGVDAVCHQKYTHTLDPQALCEFDGNYTFVHTVACHPSVANTPACPLASTQAPLSIVVVLDSEDICKVIENLIGVSGSISSHADFNSSSFVFGALKTSFFQDQTLQFQVVADSTNDFPFASSSIALVQVEDNAGVRRTIFERDNGGATAGWSFNTAASPANAALTATEHRHQFSFAPAPNVFGTVLRNVPADSDVVVAMDVAFVNPIGAKRKRTVMKRFTAADATTERSAEANTMIRMMATDDNNSVAAGTTGGVIKATLPEEIIYSAATSISNQFSVALIVVMALIVAM